MATSSFASAATVFVSFLLPWWEETSRQTGRTRIHYLVLMGGIMFAITGYGDLTGRLKENHRAVLVLVAVIVIGIGLIGFYMQVDNSPFAAEPPFTEHVRAGFFVAILGLLLAGPRFIGALLSQEPHVSEDRVEPRG